MTVPKIHILPYYEILNSCVGDFFRLYGDMFGKNNGKYILSLTANKKKIYGIFQKLIYTKILESVKYFDISSPSYYFIVGDCSPKTSFLMTLERPGFPVELDKFIRGDGFKYILRERDIDIDEMELNRIFDDIFDSLFTKKKFPKTLNGLERNMFFIRHSCLDAFAVSRIVLSIYGEVNCVNIKLNGSECLVSINKVISDIVKNAYDLNRRPDFVEAVRQTREFIQQKMSN